MNAARTLSRSLTPSRIETADCTNDVAVSMNQTLRNPGVSPRS